ncbi:hypothetical protein K456DRAFT_39526 [Colletotrichum gloeosporioides 23]|nr:hypothetical protein K456DRAFT_39526 [Colletotrichum gloeosporioides 23]
MHHPARPITAAPTPVHQEAKTTQGKGKTLPGNKDKTDKTRTAVFASRSETYIDLRDTGIHPKHAYHHHLLRSMGFCGKRRRWHVPEGNPAAVASILLDPACATVISTRTLTNHVSQFANAAKSRYLVSASPVALKESTAAGCPLCRPARVPTVASAPPLPKTAPPGLILVAFHMQTLSQKHASYLITLQARCLVDKE